MFHDDKFNLLFNSFWSTSVNVPYLVDELLISAIGLLISYDE